MFLNTKVQNRGEQKYYDFIKIESERVNLGMIVWISMLAAAIITAFGNMKVSLILGVIGIALAFLNRKRQQTLSQKLDGIKDKKEFFLQLSADDLLEMKEFPLIITRQYVLCKTDDIHIYDIEAMEKVEVGIQKETQRKTLFLTEPDGTRHEVISCVEQSEEEKLFGEVVKVLELEFSK